ncbi:FKBP-type peptidyl-prolyl cis-trans isomerase [Pelagicoccus sp. SDUM812003]|uniref:FKBP-type peptidyl-prolyl cis-trans isomerase n=1 Tax=Pelagicoccus sp. SDUM812003 TaxID=3041267 RepID=UPI00280CAEE9|nr:FKBP-type peptidyl-prolyl cis-trans isomerase [Pelagicoccus sp. SDUM812003]MDQ8203214.1 FKBP-type peptidyl-prolyl cis-trans isomerase [Pelagicoccus sp. SDUM812003]
MPFLSSLSRRAIASAWRLVLALSCFGPLLSAQDETLALDYMPPAHAEIVSEQMPDASVIEGGIRFLELEKGEGPFIENGDRVEAIYTGTLLDGTVFNRKTGRFHTYRFEVGAEPREIIRGWEMAMPYMQNGGRYKIAIPSQFAYREKGRPGQVPPFSTVVFEITILDVKR